jgi:hypothetical protein
MLVKFQFKVVLDIISCISYCCLMYLRTEKNACGWSTEKLKDLLQDLRIENDIGKIMQTSV